VENELAAEVVVVVVSIASCRPAEPDTAVGEAGDGVDQVT
jgi:hypothetical protein